MVFFPELGVPISAINIVSEWMFLRWWLLVLILIKAEQDTGIQDEGRRYVSSCKSRDWCLTEIIKARRRVKPIGKDLLVRL
jgi:hypothetical protein